MTSEKNDVKPDITVMGAEETDPELTWVEKLAEMLHMTPKTIRRGILALLATIAIVAGAYITGHTPIDAYSTFLRILDILI